MLYDFPWPSHHWYRHDDARRGPVQAPSLCLKTRSAHSHFRYNILSFPMSANRTPRSSDRPSPMGTRPIRPKAADFFDDDWKVDPDTPARTLITSKIALLMAGVPAPPGQKDYLLGVVLASYRQASMDAMIAQAALELEKERHATTTQRLADREARLTKIRRLVECNICLQPMHTSRILRCGHTFCAECIGSWRKISGECPVCRDTVGPWNTANFVIQDVLQVIKDAPGKEQS